MQWGWVFLFGGLGALARVGVATALPARGLPWGTLAVNVVGCLLIGIVFQWFEARGALASPWRLALIGGFLGGFTTFSAFGIETFDLLRSGQFGWAAGYVTASLVLGLLAVAAGFGVARALG